jgi:hypothetical protein
VTGQKLRDLDFPESAVVAMRTRDQQVIPPRGRTRLEADDHVFIVLKPEARPLVDTIFSGAEEDDAEAGSGSGGNGAVQGHGEEEGTDAESTHDSSNDGGQATSPARPATGELRDPGRPQGPEAASTLDAPVSRKSAEQI